MQGIDKSTTGKATICVNLNKQQNVTEAALQRCS